MNIIITSLLTISLVIVAPSCRKRDNCTATYIDVNNQLQNERLASVEEDTITYQNIKC